MKAKDTVMNEAQIEEIADRYALRPNYLEFLIAQAQAEISFKAGQKEAEARYDNDYMEIVKEEGKKAGYKERELVEVPLADLLEKSYKAGYEARVEDYNEDMKQHRLVGIKEVVEFVEQEGVMYRHGDMLNRWRAKIEEWGIES